MTTNQTSDVVIIGAGLTGLSAAYALSCKGFSVSVIEKEDRVGGLAAGFEIVGQPIENFYHHWFTSDACINRIIHVLNEQDNVTVSPSKTATLTEGAFYRLSTPLDVLKFKPLSLWQRMLLGSAVWRVKRIKDWKQIESVTAQQWVKDFCGAAVYEKVWKPLIDRKFGIYSPDISAVWLWNKLLLRGGSRDSAGREVLAYCRGGFPALADKLAKKIESLGGRIFTHTSVKQLSIEHQRVTAVQTATDTIRCKNVIATPALPVIADILPDTVPKSYREDLRRIRYLANVCLVLELSKKLTDHYWLNVNDSDFPFVGVIEHTNLVSPEMYNGSHVVYLSRYCPPSDDLYQLEDSRLYDISVTCIEKKFPGFDRSCIRGYHVHRAPFAQPIVECNYSQLIPAPQTPIRGLYIATMAQIYPQDRGVNYALKQGAAVAQLLSDTVSK